MFLDSLRKYEVQATYAARLAIVSAIPLVIGLWLTSRNYRSELGQILYGSKKYLLMHHASLLVALGVSFLALVLGWNSAGQRRNDRQGQSWTGFFVGGTVFTASLILMIAFYMLRLEQRVG